MSEWPRSTLCGRSANQLQNLFSVGDLTYRGVRTPTGPDAFRTSYTVWHHDRLIRTEEITGT